MKTLFNALLLLGWSSASMALEANADIQVQSLLKTSDLLGWQPVALSQWPDRNHRAENSDRAQGCNRLASASGRFIRHGGQR